MQRRITETRLTCHVIETGTPPEVMFNVFKRVINTVGKPLVDQEIRHALNPGPARDLLRELAESAVFQGHRRSSSGASPWERRRRDRRVTAPQSLAPFTAAELESNAANMSSARRQSR